MTKMVDRNNALMEFYKQPNTFEATALEFGIAKTRARQIIIKYFPSEHRMRSGPVGTVVQKSWSEPDINFIIKNYGIISARKIGDKIGRSKNSVIGKANRLRKLGLL